MHLLRPHPYADDRAGDDRGLWVEHGQQLAAAAGEVVGGVGVEGEAGGLVGVGARVQVGEEGGA